MADINLINQENKNKSQTIIYIIFFFVTLIIISSFGPINHPDALDYHIGYPYQYWLRGKFFIDGGFHQAVLGIGDYANLSFIQENNLWTIRTLQIINLPFIILFLLRKCKKKIFILIFLISPVFIQWGTIGKPLFLIESTCAINFIIWDENKDNFSRKALLISLIAAISAKISAIIISLPIIVALLINILNSTIKNKSSS